RGLCTGVVGRFGTCHASRVALAEAVRFLGQLLFHSVGGKGRQHRTATGQNAQHRTDGRTAQNSTSRFLDFLAARVEAADLRGDLRAVFTLFKVAQHFGETEHAHGNRGKVDAVLQLRNVESVTRHARVH